MAVENDAARLSLGVLGTGGDGLPWNEWHRAAEERHSIRTFLQDQPEEKLLRGLQEMAERLPASAGRVELIPRLDVGIFTGIVGGYGKVGPSPSALLFVEENRGGWGASGIGYAGEAVVLEATRLGLGTCWVGGFFDPALAAGLLELRDGERIAAVSPLGIPAARRSLGERTLKAMARSHKRKTVGELTPEGIDNWPDWARAAVELARLAPSAVNRQPWRFSMESGTDGDQLVVRVDEPKDTYRIPKRLDCGIAMAHVEVAARAAGKQGYWERRTGQDVAAFVAD